MIDLKLFLALIAFYFVMFITPGPNNAMLTASGLKFGFKKTLPHMIGIPFGHMIQISLVCLGLGKIFQVYPIIQDVLKYIFDTTDNVEIHYGSDPCCSIVQDLVVKEITPYFFSLGILFKKS